MSAGEVITATSVDGLYNTSMLSAGLAVAPTLVVTGFPSAATAGATGGFTVTVQNIDGSTATSYSGTIHFSSSDPQAVLPADYTFTAGDAGVHTFANMTTLKKKGKQTISVTDTLNGALSATDSISVT
jgi:adhesin/invasin